MRNEQTLVLAKPGYDRVADGVKGRFAAQHEQYFVLTAVGVGVCVAAQGYDLDARIQMVGADKASRCLALFRELRIDGECLELSLRIVHFEGGARSKT